MKQVEKSGIIDNILSWAKFKQNAELKKKGGSKKSKVIISTYKLLLLE